MDITNFLKKSDNEKSTFEYAATKKFTDENGKAIPWVFKKLSIDEYERIREE